MNLGLSQQDLATRIGVAKAMVGQWEIGVRDPKVAALVALAKAMECSFTWLATGDGDPKDGNQPNRALLEACVEVALGMDDADDVPTRAAGLYDCACGNGMGIRRETRAEFVILVRGLQSPT